MAVWISSFSVSTWQCHCAQNNMVYREMVLPIWCGYTWLACPGPWPQPHPVWDELKPWLWVCLSPILWKTFPEVWKLLWQHTKGHGLRIRYSTVTCGCNVCLEEAVRWLLWVLLPELGLTVQQYCSYYYCSNPVCSHNHLLADPPLQTSPSEERNGKKLTLYSAVAQTKCVHLNIWHTCVACSPLAHMYTW